MEPSSYRVDPDDPRAPAQEVWDRMDEAQRRQVLDTLPSEIPRATPPEGDRHQLPKERSKLTLKEYFRRRGRRVYLGSELPVYYADETMFAPDLIAVLDVEDHPREHWVVSHEGRGLDFVLEIHVKGDRTKDYDTNVERYARLGIPEYFLYDPPARRLLGYRLPAAGKAYEPIVPQGGMWRSSALELDLSLEGERLQLSQPEGGVLLDPTEWIDRLRRMVDDAVSRAEDASRRAEEQARLNIKLAAKLRELGVDPDEL
jgi:Uma2 family endonuclease